MRTTVKHEPTEKNRKYQGRYPDPFLREEYEFKGMVECPQRRK